MIQFLAHKHIDKQRWNNCIAHANPALPYAFSWVLDIVHPNWQGLVFNNYQAVMPLVFDKKWGFYFLRQSPWLQQLGVFSLSLLTQAQYLAFFEAIPSKFKKINYRINFENAQLPQAALFSLKKRTNLILPLNKSYPTLFQNFSTNTQRNIKKAQNKGLILQKDANLEALLAIYEQFQAPKQNGIAPHDYRVLPKLLHRILQQKKGFVWGVTNAEGDALLAANFFWYDNQRIISLLPANSNLGRQQGAMFFLINALIENFAQTATILDFEGSNIENIARFNVGFGAVPQNFLEIEKIRFPFSVFKS